METTATTNYDCCKGGDHHMPWCGEAAPGNHQPTIKWDTKSVCVLTGAETEQADDCSTHRHRIESHQPAARGGGDEWRVVLLGKNTYIERDGESPFICDMQTYDSSDAEREEARQLATQIVTEHNQHQALVAEREQWERLKSKIAWHRDGVAPDVPVLQDRYDKLLKDRNDLRSERELLRRLLRNAMSPTHCYCAVLPDAGKCWQCEVRDYFNEQRSISG